MQRWLLFLAPLCILFDSCQLFYLVLVILIGCGCLWLYFILYRVCFAFFFKALVSLINQCLLFLIFILLFSFRFEICFGFGIFSVIRLAKVTRQSQSMIIISEKGGPVFVVIHWVRGISFTRSCSRLVRGSSKGSLGKFACKDQVVN